LKYYLKIFFSTLFIIHYIFSFGQVIQSKEDLKELQLYSSTIKTSPFAILSGPIIFTAEYRLAYEAVLAKNQSFQIGVSYLGKSWYAALMENADSTQTQDKLLIRGVRAQITYKIFLDNNESPEGLYIGPHFSYSYCEFTTKYLRNYNYYLKAVYINYDGIFGYQLITNDLTIDAFCGMGYRDNTWLEHYQQTNSILDNEDLEIYHGHLKLILGINVGIAFSALSHHKICKIIELFIRKLFGSFIEY